MTHEQSPTLIVITGPPGSGKTTLSRRLGETLLLPVLQRDGLKELLFDTLGSRDRSWSRQLGGASYELLFYTLALLLQTGRSCIVESNFQGEPEVPKLRKLVQQYQYAVVCIQCRTDPATLLTRLQRRSASGERHRGHADHEDLSTMNQGSIRGFYDPLPIDGIIIELDTTDFDQIDYSALVARISDVL